MQDEHTQNPDGNARVGLSQRGLLCGAAARKQEPPTEEPLDAAIDRCVGELKSLLARMHPDAKVTTGLCRGAGPLDSGIIFNVRYPAKRPEGIRFSDWIAAREAANG